MDVVVHLQHGWEDGPHGPGGTEHLREHDDKISGNKFYCSTNLIIQIYPKTNGSERVYSHIQDKHI